MSADDEPNNASNGGNASQPVHDTKVILNNGNRVADAMANAEHLDNLEASDAVADIASFQDVELPPPTIKQNGMNGEGLDVEQANAHGNNEGESPRRAKRFYYCLPMMQVYKYHIIGSLCVVFIILLAIGLSAASFERSNEALSTANDVAADDGPKGEIIINDAPPENYSEDYSGFDDGDGGEGDEEVGEPLEQSVDLSDEYEDNRGDDMDGGEGGDWDDGSDGDEGGDGDEELGEPLEHSPNDKDDSDEETMTGQQTPPSNQDPPTEIEEINQFNPQWFETSHMDYQELFSDPANEQLHSHALAGLFCVSQDLFLCSYEDYCPNGIESTPFAGGPPDSVSNSWSTIEEVQWAPLYTDDTDAEFSNSGGAWVQVGKVPESDGGDEDNGYAQCWDYDDWMNGEGVDIETIWDEDHRRWILCCELQELPIDEVDEEEFVVDDVEEVGEGEEFVGEGEEFEGDEDGDFVEEEDTTEGEGWGAGP